MPDELNEGDAAADGRGARHADEVPARNLLRDFLHPSRGQLVVGLALFLTSLIVVVTLQSQANQPEFANARQADLIQLLDNITAETRRLEDEVSSLEESRDELLSGADQEEAARQEAARRLQQAEILAGTVAVSGPGIRLEIADPAGGVSAELLLDAVEELRDAGAEVIELNDLVRLVMSSWFGTDEDGFLTADGVPLEAPYVIEAIGDPATLEAGARFRGGLVSQVEGDRIGGTVTITQLDTVEIDTVVVPEPNEFATPR